jgi:phosphoribosylglycinamide formyltransferase-1
MNNPPRLAILGSGKGSNFVALQEAILAGKLDAQIVLVASDLPDAPILARAAAFGLRTATLTPSPFRSKLSPEGEIALVELLREHEVEWVILAGYMRVVKEPLLNAFPHRIINIHPSLLPAFKGLHAWEQALHAGVPETGCTVHFVNRDVDAGEIIAQRRVPVLAGDTPETLHARIQIAEHELYPTALMRVFSAHGAPSVPHSPPSTFPLS